jgi:hypothetical protein
MAGFKLQEDTNVIATVSFPAIQIPECPMDMRLELGGAAS